MLSVFGMPPVEYVNLVADLGCRYITAGSVGFAPVNVLGYPPFSLCDDATLGRELLAVTADRGVSISLGDGLLSVPRVDVRSYADDLDIMAELHIPRINTVSLEPDVLAPSINSLRSLLWPPIVASRPESNPLSA
jgi:hypothetical protein